MTGTLEAPAKQRRLNPEAWREVRTASEAGVSDPVLSEQYGISQGAIRIMRLRQSWNTPAKVKAAAIMQAAQKQARAVRNSDVTTISESNGSNAIPDSTAVIASQLVQIEEKAGLTVAKMAGQALEAASKTGLPIETWSDASTAYKLTRLAAGKDKEGVAVNLSLWNGVKPGEPGMVRDVGPVQTDPAPDLDQRLTKLSESSEIVEDED